MVSRCLCVSNKAQPRDFRDKKRANTINASSYTIAMPGLKSILSTPLIFLSSWRHTGIFFPQFVSFFYISSFSRFFLSETIFRSYRGARRKIIQLDGGDRFIVDLLPIYCRFIADFFVDSLPIYYRLTADLFFQLAPRKAKSVLPASPSRDSTYVTKAHTLFSVSIGKGLGPSRGHHIFKILRSISNGPASGIEPNENVRKVVDPVPRWGSRFAPQKFREPDVDVHTLRKQIPLAIVAPTVSSVASLEEQQPVEPSHSRRRSSMTKKSSVSSRAFCFRIGVGVRGGCHCWPEGLDSFHEYFPTNRKSDSDGIEK